MTVSLDEQLPMNNNKLVINCFMKMFNNRKMAEQTKQVLALAEQSQRSSAFQKVVSEFFTNSLSNSKSCISELLRSELPVPAVRALLSITVDMMPKLNNNWMLEIGNHCLEALSGRSSSFEEEEVKIRDQLYDVYCAKKEYLSAARVLSAVNFEGISRSLTSESKCDKYIKIAECYLEIGENAFAEQYNLRAGALIEQCNEITLKLRYKVCHARILDCKKDFLQAARNYYFLSQEGKFGVLESDLLQLLQCSITCAILAKAGPQRSRLLATLYADERACHLENYDMLTKLFMQRIIRKPDMEKFSEKLQDHHKALLSSGRTVLETAMIEHNILAISKLYCNLTFHELGGILDVSSAQAENYLADMVQEGRIVAVLDQRAGIAEFEGENEGLQEWENQIHLLCKSAEDLVRDIQERILIH
jgi:COP9 signalosome complex subunit 4